MVRNKKRYNLFSRLLLIALSVLTVAIAADDLLAQLVEDHCADHCEDSCETCGDCVNCLPTVHLFYVCHQLNISSFDQVTWSHISPNPSLEKPLGEGIDRPPQLA